MLKNLLLALAFTLAAGSTTAAVDPTVDDSIRASLKRLLPGLVPDSISQTPLDGLYEVTFGTRIVYVSGDGRFLVQGKLVDLETRTELTEARESALKSSALAAIGEDSMVIYGPKDAPHTVSVFTDIDCGYCRRLHAEMAKYNEAGIRVRYLFYPRSGVGSDSFNKAVSVWCADDRHAAMDKAKAGAAVESRSCDNPVADHYALGQSFAIRGTPALVLEDGSVIPGYVPPDRLRQALDSAAIAGR